MRVLRNVSMIGKLIATLGLIALGQGLVNVIYDPQTALSPTSFCRPARVLADQPDHRYRTG